MHNRLFCQVKYIENWTRTKGLFRYSLVKEGLTQQLHEIFVDGAVGG